MSGTPWRPRSPADDAQNSEKELKPHSKRRKARSAFRKWKNLSYRHTWLNPLLLMVGILCAYFVNPGEQNPFYKAIFLSYPLGPDYPGGPNMYGKGYADWAFVGFYTIVLTFTREFIMQRILRPLSVYCGMKKRGKQSRFMEQVYTAIYFGVFGPFGLYVMAQGPLWYFNTTAMFEGFPHRKHEGVFKAYYLLQAAYWAQQAVVLMLQQEKPRKDFRELVLHHIVTLSLIGLSYRFHFAKMGIAVYITHDISDFFLAVSSRSSFVYEHHAEYAADIQNVQLSRLHHCRTILLLLHDRLDLHAALYQLADSVGDIDRIPDRWTLRVELGNSAVQVLDQPGYHVFPPCLSAGGQFVLAVPDLAHR
jgi:acyl-CoA-dependent ceramide synthase